MPSPINTKPSTKARAWGVPTWKSSAVPRSSSARAPLANKPLNISSPVTRPAVNSGSSENKPPGAASRLPRGKSGVVAPASRPSPPPRPPRAPARLASLPLATKATAGTPAKPISKDFASSRTLSGCKVLASSPKSPISTSPRTPRTPASSLSRDFSSARTLSATKILSTPTASSKTVRSHNQSTESIVSRDRSSVSPPSSGARPRSLISRTSSASPPARELKFAARLRADRTAQASKSSAAAVLKQTSVTRAPSSETVKSTGPVAVKEEPKVEVKEDAVIEKIQFIVDVEEEKIKVEERKEIVEEVEKIHVEDNKPSIVEEIKKTPYSAIKEGGAVEKKIEEEKITEGLRSWSPEAVVSESMVVTELVQTTQGVVRVQRYIIAEERKPDIVVRSKWWSFGMGSRKSY